MYLLVSTRHWRVMLMTDFTTQPLIKGCNSTPLCMFLFVCVFSVWTVQISDTPASSVPSESLLQSVSVPSCSVRSSRPATQWWVTVQQQQPFVLQFGLFAVLLLLPWSSENSLLLLQLMYDFLTNMTHICASVFVIVTLLISCMIFWVSNTYHLGSIGVKQDR